MSIVDREFRSMLNETMDIYRLYLTDDGAGGKLQTYVRILSVPCRLSTIAEATMHRDVPQQLLASNIIAYTECFIPVETGYRVSVGGVVYEVVDVINPAHEFHHLEIGLRRMS